MSFYKSKWAFKKVNEYFFLFKNRVNQVRLEQIDIGTWFFVQSPPILSCNQPLLYDSIMLLGKKLSVMASLINKESFVNA
jgi:hypothetical protein